MKHDETTIQTALRLLCTRYQVNDTARDYDLQETESTITSLAMAILEQSYLPGREITSPEKTKAFLRMKVGPYKHEVFGVIFLDNRHRILKIEDLFTGTIDGASVYPRTVAQRCLEVNAAAVIFYHNHPSNTSTPSEADKRITTRLRDALALLDVRVLDHLVVTTSGATSFAEEGLL